VIVPRRAAHGEHIDDHQVQIARELHQRGLAIACAVEDLSSTVFAEAMSRTVRRVPNPPPFRLLRDSTA
jgi:UDP-N-acetylglucosamine transferase subunit ALG13